MARCLVISAPASGAGKTTVTLALLAALRSGFGIGICHAGIARRDPDLLPLLSKQFKVELEIWIVMHNELKRISRMRLMFDHLALNLAQYAAAL